MDYLINLLAMVKDIDWTSFVVAWFTIEKSLKVLSKITPWQWDDDIIEWISKTMPKKK